jgi:hypothetical protein
LGQALKETNSAQVGLERARDLLAQALAELDSCAAPGDIGARLDLVLHRVEDELRKR